MEAAPAARRTTCSRQRCSAVVETGGPVATDGLRHPMAEEDGVLWRLQQQPFYQTSVPRTIFSGTASLQTSWLLQSAGEKFIDGQMNFCFRKNNCGGRQELAMGVIGGILTIQKLIHSFLLQRKIV